MSIMENWKNWSQTQWDNWGSKLQSKYDDIDSWKTPDWVKDILEEVWDGLDATMQKKLYKLVMEICKEFNAEFAKSLIKKIKDAIKKFFIK